MKLLTLVSRDRNSPMFEILARSKMAGFVMDELAAASAATRFDESLPNEEPAAAMDCLSRAVTRRPGRLAWEGNPFPPSICAFLSPAKMATPPKKVRNMLQTIPNKARVLAIRWPEG